MKFIFDIFVRVVHGLSSKSSAASIFAKSFMCILTKSQIKVAEHSFQEPMPNSP